MRTYTATLRTDSGKINIRINGTSAQSAIQSLMAIEGCPRRAIKKIRWNRS